MLQEHKAGEPASPAVPVRTSSHSSLLARLGRILPARWQRWSVGVLVLVALLAIVVSSFVDEPLRRHVEAGMNASLQGYKVSIGRLDFHPLGFSLDLENSTVIQEANPDTPMAEIPHLAASVQWRELLFGRLVANFALYHPKILFDQKQGEKEMDDKRPIGERGWQEAVEKIYPFKINEVLVVGGEVTYLPGGDFKPLHMSDVNIRTGNIRNIRTRDQEYPSDLHLDAVVFDNATLRIDGNADFLAEPFAGIKTDLEITNLPLSYLTGVLHNYATIRKGKFSGKGAIEYAPKIKRVELETISVTGADADYILTSSNAAESEHIRRETIKKAKAVSNDPEVQLRAKRIQVSDSTLGWLDKTAKPNYRLYMTDFDLTVTDFSNQKSDGASTVDAKGKFNGTGPSTLHAVFRPQTKSPDFDLKVGIRDASLLSLNDLLRAKAGIDAAGGSMSYFSELKVRNDAIDGYVKVLFRDVDIYDPVQDKHKPLLTKAYEFIADGLSNLLENRGTDDVATKATIKGPLENPNASTWEIVSKLVQNAFFKAILPGLDHKKHD